MSKITLLRPKVAVTIERSQLSNLAMVAGGEKKIEKVILDGELREWIGFGWIDIRKASAADYRKYPVVVE